MILVSGCSWSDSNFKTDYHPEMQHDYPKWFDYMETDEKVVSIGVCGNSNDTIIDKALEQIFVRSDITRVVIALTEWTRFSFLKHEIHPALLVLKDLINNNPNKSEREIVMIEHIDSWIQIHSKWVKVDELKTHHYVPHVVNKTMLKLRTIQEVCKSKNIELYVFQMLWPLNNECEEMGIKTLIKNDIFQKMYSDPDDNFINFPFFKKLGGECVETMLKSQNNYKELTVSDVDKHPNGKGHKLIGEWFNEQIKIS